MFRAAYPGTCAPVKGAFVRLALRGHSGTALSLWST